MTVTPEPMTPMEAHALLEARTQQFVREPQVFPCFKRELMQLAQQYSPPSPTEPLQTPTDKLCD